MELADAMRQRRSVKAYQSDATISDEQLKALFEDVILTPSSFNIQHWHFIVVRDEKNKQDLMERAFNQPQVGECAAAIIVVADPLQWKNALDYWRKSDIPDEQLKSYEQMMPGPYADDRAARDEALRSIGMAAMALMLRATDMGFQTGPMIGFDADKVSERFGIESPRFPAMLIVLGKQDATRKNHPRPYRRPVSDVVRLESASGNVLE